MIRLVILGRPGVGKTTLVKRVAEHFPGLFHGFYTEEIREGRIRTGFRIVTLSGKRGVLATKGGASPLRVGAYAVFVEDFERLVLPELENALKQKVPLLVDEIVKWNSPPRISGNSSISSGKRRHSSLPPPDSLGSPKSRSSLPSPGPCGSSSPLRTGKRSLPV
jgi:hypothetical protein